MSGNGAQAGARDAVFFKLDEVFAALDSLDPPVRRALYDAPVPFSPVQVRDYARQSGLRGEALAAVVKRMSDQHLASACRAFEMATGKR